MLTVGCDVGESAGIALVETRPGRRPLLRLLVEVHGTRWDARAIEGCRHVVGAAGGPVPCWVERPPSIIRSGAGMQHHNAGIGIGRRIGKLELAWLLAAGEPAELVEPRTWWRSYRGMKGKRDGKVPGWERVAQAGMYVEGAAERLALVGSVARRVDLAESILIAASRGIANEQPERT